MNTPLHTADLFLREGPESQRVLVIEGDPFAKSLYLKALKAAGFFVVATATSGAGCELYEQFPFDVVIVDDEAPGATPEDFRAVWARTQSALVIWMSSGPDDGLGPTAPFLRLPKPVLPGTLRKIVERLSTMTPASVA